MPIYFLNQLLWLSPFTLTSFNTHIEYINTEKEREEKVLWLENARKRRDGTKKKKTLSLFQFMRKNKISLASIDGREIFTIDQFEIGAFCFFFL